jgi:superfamily II DNA or RNA helicase
MTTLRSYQEKVVDELLSTTSKRVILVAPTGSGKTVIASALIKRVVTDGKRVIFVAHRREIIAQTSQKLFDSDIDHGVIQADCPTRPDAPVQVASIQTLHARTRSRRLEPPLADYLIIDECHPALASTYHKLIRTYPDATLIGLTATPCRGDGRGLGGIFETMIECPQVPDLIEQGHLVKTRVYAPVNPNLKGVSTQAGDYVESQLADRMNRDDLVGDIVTHWHKYGERRRTVCFAVDVRHSIHIRDEFTKSGVSAEHIDGTTPKPQRDAVLRRLASGETSVVTNCMVLTEGWDCPAMNCIILARPTKKMGLYRQMIGRGLRPADGKRNVIVLDHSGAVFRHGFVEDRVEWTLDPDRKAESPTHQARLSEGYRSRFVDCSQCGAIRQAGEPCAHCGFYPQRHGDAVIFCDGNLGLVSRNGTVNDFTDPTERLRWHGMLTHIARERAYQPGWIAHKFRERFGMWPGIRGVSPIEPSLEAIERAFAGPFEHADGVNSLQRVPFRINEPLTPWSRNSPSI